MRAALEKFVAAMHACGRWPDSSSDRAMLDEALEAAEAALAAPQEPVATVAEVHMSHYTIEWANGPLPEGTKLYAALAAPQEPARQSRRDASAHIKAAMSKLEAAMRCHPNAVQPLIGEAWDEMNEAHGITGETK